jgi:ABC-type phosphate transport system substrate-binding protein
VDPDESFYDTKAGVTRAIANGKYPSPPARELYLVTRDQFTGLTRVFVRWILTDGQKFVDPMGYIVLPQDRIKAGLDRLGDMQVKMKMERTITVSGAFALYPMMVRWSEEFNKLYPEVKFNISAGGAGKGMTDALGRMVDLGMVSREINPAEVEKGAAWIAVTKDAVVPVANAQNPFKSDLLKKGVKKQAFVDIWISGKTTDWKELVK